MNDFSNLFSDAHFGLSLGFEAPKYDAKIRSSTKHDPKPKLWDSEKK